MAAAIKKRSSLEEQAILTEARERFKRCQNYEASFRAHFRDDIKFDAADAYNNYQWPAAQLQQRTKRPCLTINRTRQHNLDILNDARQSKVAVKVRPLRGGADFQSAMILDGVIRHIEYISNADSAYQMALGFAVRGGIGYCRLVTDYTGDDTFDQEIFIRPVKDPMSIYLDPDIQEFDGSDARFGFVFSEVPQDEFKRAHPKKTNLGRNTELAPDQSWVTEDKVRMAEYFRCVPDEDKLYGFEDPETGEKRVMKASEMEAELLAQVVDNPATTARTVIYTKVEHFTIVGDEITEEKVWPGKYIPILRCVGEETEIDGVMDRKGHTRALLDSQRMFNYNASASVEYGALQTKVPYLAAVKAIEGYEEVWKSANTENYAYLPWNHTDEDGDVPVPPPTRPPAPSGAPVFMQGMRDALEQMYLASGQNQADFGQPGNERSGVAIEARQRQGDNATYHYLDHQATMIRFLGKQILDLLQGGKVYDTARIVQYRDDAGNEGQVHIDPEAPQHFAQQEGEDGQTVSVLNPKLGVYDVMADVGPAYATRRQEAFAAFSQLLSQNKELVGVVGDIWMRFADIPGAEEAAERMKRLIPKAALSDGPDPDVQKLQAQIEGMTHLIGELNAKLESKDADDTAKQEKNSIAGYQAITARIAALKEALATDPERLMRLVTEVLDEGISTSGDGSLGPALDVPAPKAEELHPAVGGLSPGPEPHAPPVDPNKAPAEPAAA